MSGTLTIHVNRDDLYSLEAPDSFSTAGSFAIALRNHGAPVHVHLNIDDPLTHVVDFEASNHYLDAEATRTIDVPVRPGASTVSGTLRVATAHGAESRLVDVTVERPEERTVEVDPELSKPAPRETDGSLSAAFGGAAGTLPTPGSLAVLLLGILALVLALAIVSAIGGVGAAVGAFVVLVAVGVAVYLAYS